MWGFNSSTGHQNINGAPLQIWDCNAENPRDWRRGQDWAFDDKASFIYSSDEKCVDLFKGGLKNATPVLLFDCTTAGEGGFAIAWNQQWLLGPSKSLQSMASTAVVV